MKPTEIARFRTLCGGYRWLAVFMVGSVGALLILFNFGWSMWLRRDGGVGAMMGRIPVGLIISSPSFCYLFAVWSIGDAMGQLKAGRLIQPTLARALRRVGLALGIGGLLEVFGVLNLLALIGSPHATGLVYWNVAAMTVGMIGGALFLLGRVVDRASALQAELDEMI